MSSSHIVAGIDVGGRAKGFHAVALQAGKYLDQFTATEAKNVADWCCDIRAEVVGIDAPCRWSSDGRARPAELQLMQQKIWCFATPSRDAAEAHPKDHFRWMLNGAELYAELERTHQLVVDDCHHASEQLCFETFPQAIACALSGEIVSATRKRSIRRALLDQAGIDTRALTNIDRIDAALCALAAHLFSQGNCQYYGDPRSGYIVVPGVRL